MSICDLYVILELNMRHFIKIRSLITILAILFLVVSCKSKAKEEKTVSTPKKNVPVKVKKKVVYTDGCLYLGMSIEDVIASCGKPHRRFFHSGKTIIQYIPNKQKIINVDLVAGVVARLVIKDQ